MQTNLRGELTIQKKEYFSLHSNAFIDGLTKIMGIDKNKDHIVVNTLLPTVINELVEQNNINMLMKMKNEIRHISFKDYCKKNPLHIAAMNGNYEITKFLINCRVNINELDDTQQTPLNYACKHRYFHVAKLILEHGGVLNLNQDFGAVFCNFAFESDLEAIKIYHQCGAYMLMGDYDKRTVAHIAAAEGEVDIIKYLINEAALNIMVEDRWGNTPINDCTQEIRKILIEKFNLGIVCLIFR